MAECSWSAQASLELYNSQEKKFYSTAEHNVFEYLKFALSCIIMKSKSKKLSRKFFLGNLNMLSHTWVI